MQIVKQIEKLKGIDDLYYLAKYILGYHDMQPEPHHEMCDFITTWNKNKKMMLVPRGCFKTSLGTVSYSIQQILQNPNIRILLASETYHQSITILREIKAKLESETFVKLYGEHKSSDLWRDTEIAVTTRTIVRRDATVACAGIDTSHTGSHFDLIIVDDPHSQKNVTTREQIEQVKDWYRLLLSMLEPNGKIFIIGTKWDYDDLYATIINELPDTYDIMVRQAVENGKLFFPSRLTSEFLEAQRREQGEYIFSTQYMMNPIPTALQCFKESDIRYYDEPPEDLSIFITCDPSLTEDEKAKGDYTAIVVVGVSAGNNWYILDLVNEHLSPDQIIQKLYELYVYWGPLKIGIESVAFSKLLKSAFEKYMWSRNIYPQVEELKSGGIQKEMRIKSLQPMFEQHKVWMKKPDFINQDAWAVLHSQLLHFPKSAFDDCVDALAYVSLLAHFKPEKKQLTEIEKRIKERIKKDRQRTLTNSYTR